MNTRKIFTVFKKELSDTLRDRRTLMVMLLVPVLLYPALIAFSTQVQVAAQAKLERDASPVAVSGVISPCFDSLLNSDTLLKITSSDSPAQDLKTKMIAAYMNITNNGSHDSIQLFFDGAVDRSRLALNRLKNDVDQFKKLYQKDTLRALGVDVTVLERYPTVEINTAPPSRMGSYILGMLLPMLLIITMIMGAMYPAIDLTAGEKERGTMETILSVPVNKNELFLGKYLTVCTIAMITGFTNLFSMLLTFSTGIIQAGITTESLKFTLTPQAVGLLFLLMIPLAMFGSAVLFTGAVFTRSFKDAQNVMTPILFILMIPAMTSVAPGIELNGALSLIPILNVSLLFKDILLNNFNFNLMFLVFLSNAVFAIAGIITASSAFGREEVLLGDGRGMFFSVHRDRIIASRVASPNAAVMVFAIVMALLFYGGVTAQSISVYPGLAFTEWVLILLPPVIFAWYMRLNFRETFNLRNLKLLTVLGTLLLTAGTLVMGVWAGIVQAHFFPESIEMAETMKKLLDIKESNVNLPMLFFLIAVSPAICEEMLFRGFLLSALKGRMRSMYTVTIVAFLFAIIHMNLFRLLPTFLIGITLSFIVLRTGSIYLSMIAHCLNNGFVIMLIAYPSFGAHFSWFESTSLVLPPAIITGSVVLIIIGSTLIVKSTRKPSS